MPSVDTSQLKKRPPTDEKVNFSSSVLVLALFNAFVIEFLLCQCYPMSLHGSTKKKFEFILSDHLAVASFYEFG